MAEKEIEGKWREERKGYFECLLTALSFSTILLCVVSRASRGLIMRLM